MHLNGVTLGLQTGHFFVPSTDFSLTQIMDHLIICMNLHKKLSVILSRKFIFSVISSVYHKKKKNTKNLPFMNEYIINLRKVSMLYMQKKQSKPKQNKNNNTSIYLKKITNTLVMASALTLTKKRSIVISHILSFKLFHSF